MEGTEETDGSCDTVGWMEREGAVGVGLKEFDGAGETEGDADFDGDFESEG